MNTSISEKEFELVKSILFNETGIVLSQSKHSMVESRLLKRLVHYQVDSFSEYLKIVQISKKEKEEFINELSTNETYFFREQVHFDFLEKIAKKEESFRVWSAAASIGAEAYSVAMVLSDIQSLKYIEILASDINTHTLRVGQRGLYPIKWLEKIPEKYRKKYCLAGTGTYADKMLVDVNIIKKVDFKVNNLTKLEEGIDVGMFNVIFLRNVLIYFAEEARFLVIQNVLKHLRVGGYLIVSLTETIDLKLNDNLKFIENSIYIKVEK